MRATLALVVVLAAAGCPGDDDAGDGSDYVAIDSIGEAYKDAQCTHLAACGLFPSKDACLAAEIAIDPELAIDPDVVAAVYRGHVAYDGNAVFACLDALANRACDRTAESARVVPAACDAFFRGTLRAGEICYLDTECVSQECSGSSTGTCTMGVCIGDAAPSRTRASIGEACTITSDCVAAAFCDTMTDECAALKAGDADCTLDIECAYGLACVGATGARRCGALPATGQPCATGGVCRDEGTYCDAVADICTPLGTAGEACAGPEACSPYYPCATTCTQGPALGEACSSSNRCFDAGTYCDFAAGLCVAKKPDGTPCDTDVDCTSDVCDAGVCGSATSCPDP